MTNILKSSNSKVNSTNRNCYILISAFLRNLLNTQLELSQVDAWQMKKTNKLKMRLNNYISKGNRKLYISMQISQCLDKEINIECEEKYSKHFRVHVI